MWLERIQEIREDDDYKSLNLSIQLHLAKFMLHFLRDKIHFLITEVGSGNQCLQIEKVIQGGVNEIITNDEFIYYLQLTLWQEIVDEYNTKNKEYHEVCDIFKGKPFKEVQQHMSQYFPSLDPDVDPTGSPLNSRPPPPSKKHGSGKFRPVHMNMIWSNVIEEHYPSRAHMDNVKYGHNIILRYLSTEGDIGNLQRSIIKYLYVDNE